MSTKFFQAGLTGYAFFKDLDSTLHADLGCAVSFNSYGYACLSAGLCKYLPDKPLWALCGFDEDLKIIVFRLFPRRYPGTHKINTAKAFYVGSFLTALGIPTFTSGPLPACFDPKTAEIQVAFPHEALDKVGGSML
jgi:hypothetical protein